MQTKKDGLERFWKRVTKQDNGCWFFDGSLSHGYGQFFFNGKNWRAHRWAYINIKGKISKGLVLDHLCRNRKCCNPDHLEAITFNENVKRGNPNAIIFQRKKTHCPNGHEYQGRNVMLYGGRRYCRSCTNIRNKFYGNMKRRAFGMKIYKKTLQLNNFNIN